MERSRSRRRHNIRDRSRSKPAIGLTDSPELDGADLGPRSSANHRLRALPGLLLRRALKAEFSRCWLDERRLEVRRRPVGAVPAPVPRVVRQPPALAVLHCGLLWRAILSARLHATRCCGAPRREAWPAPLGGGLAAALRCTPGGARARHRRTLGHGLLRRPAPDSAPESWPPGHLNVPRGRSRTSRAHVLGLGSWRAMVSSREHVFGSRANPRRDSGSCPRVLAPTPSSHASEGPAARRLPTLSLCASGPRRRRRRHRRNRP